MATSASTSIGSVRAQSDAPWWLLLIQGIVTLILGLLLLFNPVATTMAIVVFIGASWLVSGVLDLVGLLSDRRNLGWKVLSGVLGIWAGLVVLGQPVLSTIMLPTLFVIFVAVSGLFYGAVRIIHGLRGGGWVETILGIVAIILSLMLLSQPLVSALALPFVFGAIAVVGGVMAIIAAFRMR
ncbi:MAG: HdeD family acid-resistance protein [Chloroflexota bacterium]|nr:MAG: hypothetical protein DIU80_15220 [Chloroflexota bacterium]